jgi:hypothetical protein
VGYAMTGAVDFPVPVEEVLRALRAVAEAQEAVSVRRESAEDATRCVDVAVRRKDGRGADRVRLTLRDEPRGTSVLEHGHRGLRGAGDAHQSVVADLLQRMRDAVARALVEESVTASGGYVGTLVGGSTPAFEPGRSVAVLFGLTTLTLVRGVRPLELTTDRLAEVAAVPANAAGADPALLRGVRVPVETVVRVVTKEATHLVHVAGVTTSLANAELARLQAELRPRPVAVAAPAEVRDPGGKLTPVELVREMASLARMHHAGRLDEDEYALAKSELLGTDS